ncbi:HEAT repeat domain-containing protein [Microbacterium chocolatum]|uniref:HEAT repeat domain-containing protein n=1 Tax=Microbacterium aurantiacum TaxID=162393 RepID=UPI00338EF7D5
MNESHTRTAAERLGTALSHASPSTRLQAAMTAGTHPDTGFIDVLLARCAVEPDFPVRDMLTWALIRQDRSLTTGAVLRELRSPLPQARSQALHTLSKIADPETWPAVTAALLHDDDAEVSRTAWRAASGLVPPDDAPRLAAELVAELGRGAHDTQRSLSRAFVAVGAPSRPALDRAVETGDDRARAHAVATLALMDSPDDSFDEAVAEAKRVVALRAAPRPEA